MMPETAYPRVKCVGPDGMTREQLLTALYNCNATCGNCHTPFTDGEVCTWAGGNQPVIHGNCDAPFDTGEL